MKPIELLFDEVSMKRAECLRQIGILNAKAEVYSEQMVAIDRLRAEETKALNAEES